MNRPIYEIKADFFKTLGHPARIRVLEVLRDGELPVNEMIPLVGIEASHLSQQLAVLRKANVVRSRRAGSTVLYTVVDARIFQLLEVAKAIITGSLAETRDLLAELETVEFAEPARSSRRRT